MSWLSILCVVFALGYAIEEKAVAQGPADGQQGSERMHATNHELAALLKRLEEGWGPDEVERDGSGNVISVALRWTNSNNRALYLVSTIGSLQKLTIQGRGSPDEWTREGISCLGRLTNLTTLRVACVAPKPALKQGVFEEICNLRGLRSLSLVSACPERSEYVALTNLQNLAELNVSYATNFGDAELCLLTNLVNLRNLSIRYDAVSREGTNVLSRMPRLTNATVTTRTFLP
jgi:hypothetical protein